MNLKLDENLGVRCMKLFAAAGHDVATVVGEGLAAAVDADVIARCRLERRALVTLDLDFSNPLVYPPLRYCGIAVLRLPKQPSHSDLVAAVKTLVNMLYHNDIEGRLWSVEIGRVRVYQESDE